MDGREQAVDAAGASGRREFLRRAGRGVVVMLLGAVGGALLPRSRRGLPPGQTCRSSGICRGCSSLADCGLPQALSAKQAGVQVEDRVQDSRVRRGADR